MAKDDFAIKIENISKVFRLPHERKTSIKSIFVNLFRKTTYEEQEALKNISLEIKKGDFFGIVGRNGSGKSTLLKLIAEIYTPTNGSISINGTLTPFIELGVGFNPELTGRENIFLNGALLGINRNEMEKLYDQIVEFAELERFMDQKLKNYSSGMQVRLAFSISIFVKSEILLIDEVLAVGDASFQRKCNVYFEQLKREGKTVILVTHDMSAVAKYCSKAALLDAGEIKKIGKPKDVIEGYDQINTVKSRLVNLKGEKTIGQIQAEITDIRLANTGYTVKDDKNIELIIDVTTGGENDIEVAVGLVIQNELRNSVVWESSEMQGFNLPVTKVSKKHHVKVSIANIFPDGLYSFDVVLNNGIKDYKVYDKSRLENGLLVKRDSLNSALFQPEVKFSLVNSKSNDQS